MNFKIFNQPHKSINCNKFYRLNVLEGFVESLITQCKEPNIRSAFEADVVDENEEYIDSIKQVVRETRTYIGENVVNETSCLGIFSNCFVPTKAVKSTDLCHNGSNGEKLYKAFTFLKNSGNF